MTSDPRRLPTGVDVKIDCISVLNAVRAVGIPAIHTCTYLLTYCRRKRPSRRLIAVADLYELIWMGEGKLEK